MIFTVTLILALLNSVSCETHVNGEKWSELKRQLMKEMNIKFEQLEARLISKIDGINSQKSYENKVNSRNDTDDLEERVQILELEMDNVENNIEILETNIEILENQDSILEVRIIDMEDDVSNNQINIEDIEGRVDSMESAITNLTSAVNELFNTDAAFEERITNVEEAVLQPWTACESSPCDNGATCVDVNVDTFICLCRDGFFGTTCSNSYADASFLATITENLIDSVTDPLVFNQTRFNPGGFYDNTTGIYTVPHDGMYEFSVTIRALTDPHFGFFLYVGEGVGAFSMNTDAAGTGSASTGLTVPLHLHTGQQVWVSPYLIEGGIYGGQSDHMQSWFSGQLLSAD